MTRRTALARARRGAAFLDTKYKTWRRKISIDELDLGEPTYVRGDCGCVLAQLDAAYGGDGSYFDRAGRLGLDDIATRERLGFTGLNGGDFVALTAAWKSVLADA